MRSKAAIRKNQIRTQPRSNAGRPPAPPWFVQCPAPHSQLQLPFGSAHPDGKIIGMMGRHGRFEPQTGNTSAGSQPSCAAPSSKSDLDAQAQEDARERIRLPARDHNGAGRKRSWRHAPILPRRRPCWRSATSIWKISAPGATRKAASSGASTTTTKPPRCPILLDVVRLAASAMLGRCSASQLSLKAICVSIFDGYERGIDEPEAFVLDRKHMWLRARFVVGEAERTKFWQKIESQCQEHAGEREPEQPPARWLKLFAAALPDPSITLAYWRRTAGTGSLGRPRWLGYGTWRGGPLLREGKALVPSGWTRAWRRRAPAPQRHRPRPLSLARPVVRGKRQSAGAAAVGQQPQIDVTNRAGATRLAAIPTCYGPWAESWRPSISACATAATRCARIWKSASGAGFAPPSRTATGIRRPRIRRVEEVR